MLQFELLYLSESTDDDDIPDFDTLRQHDCNTMRKFDSKNATQMNNEWPLSNIKEWKLDWTPKKYQHKVNLSEPYTRYNYAYGIPIIAVDSFPEEALKRACYLVRSVQ